MPTLLLSARQTDDAQLLWRSCIALRWEVVRVHGWQIPTLPKEQVVVYGEPLFAMHAAKCLGLKLLEPPVDWLPQLPARWRGRDAKMMTLAEARAVKTRSFIKPADEKCFDAKVYTSGAELPVPGPLPEDLPVLVQEVVKWNVEYRCFVLDRKVMTLSAYWRDGRLAKAEDGSWPINEDEARLAKEFCEQVLADDQVKVPEAVVVDVGIIDGHGWAVVESNAAFAAGMYGCDPQIVLGVLREACRRG